MVQSLHFCMHAYFFNEVDNKPRRKTKRYLRIPKEKPRTRNMRSDSHTQRCCQKNCKGFSDPITSHKSTNT